MNPYLKPMPTFMQAPSFQHQNLVNYNGRPNLQGLSSTMGPMMFPVNCTNCQKANSLQFAYPLNRSPMSQNTLAYTGPWR